MLGPDADEELAAARLEVRGPLLLLARQQIGEALRLRS